MTASSASAVTARPPSAARPRLAAIAVSTALLLAVAGALLSAYLVYENAQGESGVCVIAHGCSTVQNSRYGNIAGIPISVPGLGLYVALAYGAVLWLRDAAPGRAAITALAFLGSLFGVIFSGYLTYLEAFVIDAWCIYCVTSAILVSAIFLIWAGLLAGDRSGRPPGLRG